MKNRQDIIQKIHDSHSRPIGPLFKIQVVEGGYPGWVAGMEDRLFCQINYLGRSTAFSEYLSNEDEFVSTALSIISNYENQN